MHLQMRISDLDMSLMTLIQALHYQSFQVSINSFQLKMELYLKQLQLYRNNDQQYS